MRGTAKTSWLSVKEEVIRRIHDKHWKQGDLIPNEANIAEELGCSRATVNRALQSVADAGLLDRRRKGGTRVATYPVRKATLGIPVIRKEITAKGSKYDYELISRTHKQPPASIALKLGLSNSAKVLHLVCVHMADDIPYVIEDRWLNQLEVPAALKVDFSQQSPNEWLVANVPFKSGEISFSARVADATDAQLLKCQVGAGLFTIDRTTLGDKHAITSVRLSFAPEYQMTTTI
jgi:GntR family histidine utilization transcriptional repressor